MTDSEPVLQTANLTKTFGGIDAVQGLDLTVRQGEIYGFLGPNGAGKTTTIHMILSLVRPTSGQIWLFGDEVDASASTPRERIGVLPGHGGLYDNLTAREHLEFVARIKQVDIDPEYFCERVGLASAVDQQAGGFSTGMRQRLKLAMALVGDPELLILDEPTRGLDPNGARQMRQLIEAENEQGTTVFFSSHILGQVEQTCDRVGILDNGSLVAEDTISELRTQLSEPNTLQVTFETPLDDACSHVDTWDGVVSSDVDGNIIELVLEERRVTNEVLAELCTTAEPSVQSVSTEGQTLGDLFATYTETEVEA